MSTPCLIELTAKTLQAEAEHHNYTRYYGEVTVEEITPTVCRARLLNHACGIIAVDPASGLWRADGHARYYSTPLPAAADLAMGYDVAAAKEG